MRKCFWLAMLLLGLTSVSCQKVNHERKEHETKDPFTITSMGDIRVSLFRGDSGSNYTRGVPISFSYEYRKGTESWHALVPSYIDLADGEYVQIREVKHDEHAELYSGLQFEVEGDGTIKVSGNIMSLLDGTLKRDTVPIFYFNNLFSNCKLLIDASELKLPATTLAKGCYESMFRGCTSLTKAPELPATTLAEGCYESMFMDCTSLTRAPDLPATTLVESCYRTMFANCCKLNYVKAMFTDPHVGTLDCEDWLFNVSPTGTFVKNRNAAWDVRGVSGIPYGWIVETE